MIYSLTSIGIGILIGIVFSIFYSAIYKDIKLEINWRKSFNYIENKKERNAYRKEMDEKLFYMPWNEYLLCIEKHNEKYLNWKKNKKILKNKKH